jgi:hypothetical protein
MLFDPLLVFPPMRPAFNWTRCFCNGMRPLPDFNNDGGHSPDPRATWRARAQTVIEGPCWPPEA